ncbi:MAG: adenosylcobinamide-GDP ribazoletransferase [Bacillota bacterium]
MRWLYRIIFAFQLLTRIPLPVKMDVQAEDYAYSIYFFPVVGAVVGAVAALFYALCTMAGLYVVGYFAAVFIPVLITGALHVDGLADTCDALFSVRSRERMLEIMSDPRLGVMGVCALVLDFLMRAALLIELSLVLTPYSMAMIIAVLPVMGKVSLITGGALHPYARKDGMGKNHIDQMHAFHMLVAAVLGGAVLEVLFNEAWIFLVVVPLSVGAFAAWRMARKLGGLTGDTLGALNELGEIFFLLGVLIWSKL